MVKPFRCPLLKPVKRREPADSCQMDAIPNLRDRRQVVRAALVDSIQRIFPFQLNQIRFSRDTDGVLFRLWNADSKVYMTPSNTRSRKARTAPIGALWPLYSMSSCALLLYIRHCLCTEGRERVG